MMVPAVGGGPGRGGMKKHPRLFQVRGVECCSRGTTLVQPPVTRTALKASNKAAAANEANRPALLFGSGGLLGDQLSTGRPHTGLHQPPAL